MYSYWGCCDDVEERSAAATRALPLRIPNLYFSFNSSITSHTMLWIFGNYEYLINKVVYALIHINLFLSIF